MAVQHDNVVNKIIMRFSGEWGSLFYLVTGSGWVGKGRKFTKKQTVTVDRGDVIVRAGKFIKFGMQTGAPDIIGYKNVLITEDMVGTEMPVFVAVDVKTGRDKLSPEQQLFIDKASTNNAITGVIRDTDTDEEVNERLSYNNRV